MDDLTELEEDSLFRLNPLTLRPYEKDYDVQMDITIERDLALNILARSGYTILDLLSDVGGMQSILVSGFAIVLAVLNYNYFDTYLASRLFKIKKPDAKTPGKYKHFFDRAEFFKPPTLSNSVSYVRDLLPGCCTSCKTCKQTLRL